jgi:hypothetical protein
MPRTPERPPHDCTWSRPGGRPLCLPTPSALPSSSPSRARIADAAGGVSDEVWANAARRYDENQLGALVSLIALINTFNRLNVVVQQLGGDYQPGQFG